METSESETPTNVVEEAGVETKVNGKEGPSNGEVEETMDIEEEEKKAAAPPVSNEADERSFSMKNLKHPGGWKTNVELLKVFEACESFNIEFSRHNNTKLKTGQVHFVFSSVKEAQAAYKSLEPAKLDGAAVEIAVADSFVCPSDFFTIPKDDEMRARTLYALNMESASKDVLDSLLGSESIESVSFLSQDDDKQHAQVVMTSKEEAESAKQDANVFDDEDPSSVIKLVTPDEYLGFVKDLKEKKTQVKPSPAPVKKEPLPPKVEAEPIAMAPEIDEDDVIAAIDRYVENQRLNWAELNECEELYQICDAVSTEFGGLPDSILKPAMLSTLQRHLTGTESHWLKEHIQSLIQYWKHEVNSEQSFARESQVVMRAPDYQPPTVIKKKKKEKDTKAARVMMGVGALLQLTRQTLKTENGDVEIDEDDSGNIMLNGETLSFDSWAKVTRTNQPEVVSINQGAPQKPKKQKIKPEFADYKAYQQYKKEQFEIRQGNRKLKLMQQARDEMEAFESAERAAGGSETPAVVVTPAPKPPKELDEGEIDSEEERQEEKNRKRKHSSSSSSSSSSEESDDGVGDASNARLRRSQKRKLKQKKQLANPQNNPALMKMFDYRHQIIMQLPPEQKSLFLNVLREKMDTKAVPTAEQSHLYRQFSDDCVRLSR